MPASRVPWCIDEQADRSAHPAGHDHKNNRDSDRIEAGTRATICPLLVLVALGLCIGALNHDFFDLMNLSRIAVGAAIPLTIALGAAFVIQLGSIDLSAEGIVAVAAIAVSMLVENSYNENHFGLWVLAVALAAGAVLGLANGVLHVFLRIPSFITTLAIGFVATGIGTAWLSGNTIRVSDPSLRAISITRYLGVPLSVWIAVPMLGVAWFVYKHTLLGRHTLAIGGGEDLARLSGVRVSRVRIAVFALAGVFYGVAGILAVAQYGQGHARIADGQLFVAIPRSWWAERRSQAATAAR